MKHNLKHGFTLIELIVVIAIISVLSAIIIPSVASYIQNARIATDVATVRILNSATSITRIFYPDNDIFTDTSKSNEELMQYLVNQGQLPALVYPQTPSSSFAWSFNDEKWFLLSGNVIHTISLSDGLRFGDSGWSSSHLLGPFTGNATNILIPTTIEGNPIRVIWQDVFNNKGLLSVSFESDSQIEHIHARAFRNNNLADIVLPEGLRRIDRLAFDGNNIKSVVIPNSVTTIETSAFTGIERITVGSNLNFVSHPTGNTSQLENAINGNNKFRDAYLAHGAGTYVWNGNDWIKE